MTVANIILTACETANNLISEQSWGNYQISNSYALRVLNMVKDNFWSRIVSESWENRKWQQWTADTVALQSEYTQPIMSSSVTWAKLVKDISINYDGETYATTWELHFQKCREVDPSSLRYDWSWYKENQDRSDPIFYIADDSIFIAPVPRSWEAGIWRLRITGIRNIVDYNMSSTESDTGIPSAQHEVLVQWMLPYLWRKQGNFTQATSEQREYERIATLAAHNLAERSSSPFYATYPDEEQLENNISSPII